MSLLVELLILAASVTCTVYVGAIHTRLGEANKGLHRLLRFLDGAHVEHRRERQGEQLATGTFRKILIDTVRGCRDSIDAIRSTTDELSDHRRETVEVRPSSKAAQAAAGLSRPKSLRQGSPTRPRSAATLPSMGAVSAPESALPSSSDVRSKKESCHACLSGNVRLPGGTIAACEVCGGSGLVPTMQRAGEARS
ncbi:MAG: hypothetical protein ABI193_16450 [Minicystis sp.]